MLIKKLNRRQIFFFTKKIKPALRLDKNFLGKGSSDEKVEVVIPCLEKDLITLPLVVKSLRKFLNHPLGNIYIVAPARAREVKKFCQDNSCVFIDEKTVAPVAIKKISYKPKGQDRAGWIYQQLLKLSGDAVAKTSNFLVWDADTALVKPQAYTRRGKFILNHSDEYRSAYHENYRKLMKAEIESPVSFIAHQMIFSKEILQEIKAMIENLSGKEWWVAILDSLDKNEPSSFSEYELYGNYIYSHCPDRMIIEYWFNTTRPRADLATLDEACQKYSKDFKTASWHSYN